MSTTSKPGRSLAFAAAVAVTVAAGLTGRLGPELRAQALQPHQRLAVHLGLPEHRLGDLVADQETLLDGSRLTTIKAIDRATGDIVGVSLRNDQPVDRREAIAAAGAAWRAINGAMTPALVDQLAVLGPGQAVEIDLWFPYSPPESDLAKGPDQPPLSREPSPEQLAELAQALAAEAEAKAWAAGRTTDKSDGDTPLSPGEAARVLAAATGANPDPGTPASEPASDKAFEGDGIVISQERLDRSAAELAADELRDRAYIDEVRASLAAQRAPLLARLQAAAVDIIELSEIAPTMRLQVNRAQIVQLARWPEIDALYVTPTLYGEELSIARPTQNATLVNDAGYNGAGVIVSVTEGGRVFGENPFLTVDSYCDAAATATAHATAVAGFIASTHGTHRGLANGATLRNANCATVDGRIDWGAANARVLNHSFFQENSPGAATFLANDRRLDYISRTLFDTPVKSAGNVGNGCVDASGFVSDFVTSPGKGYNTVTVGNFNQGGTLAWGNDVMANCSSFGNPRGDGVASGGHEKPELAASGSALNSTTVSATAATAVGGVGGGTSFAAPMVVATAANMIQALPALSPRPEAIKPILMAGALHNIEGASGLSDRDGAGGLVASSSLAIVERGHLDYRALADGDAPFTMFVLAKEGERVRFAMHWQSNANAAYTNDQLPADMDLRAWRGACGSTLQSSSLSVRNPFEVIEFTAPETNLYCFEVTQFGSWTGGSTFFGAGWWRGVDRLSNGYWQTVTSAPEPLGDHYELRPTEATPSNYWHGAAIRPNTADYDLRLYSRDWFNDPDGRQLLNTSAGTSNNLDYIVVDGNRWPSANRQYYRVNTFSGTGAYQLSAGKHGTLLGSNSGGLFGPYTLNAIQSMFIADIAFQADSMRRIRLIPAAGSNDDFALALFRSTDGDPLTYTRSRAQSAISSDTGGIGAGEKFRYRYDGSASAFLGLVVTNKTYNSAAEFYIQVTPSAIFSDGFDGD